MRSRVRSTWPLVGGPCSRCGRDPAEGYAFIDHERFCHGDNWDEPFASSCYELAQRDILRELTRLGEEIDNTPEVDR